MTRTDHTPGGRLRRLIAERPAATRAARWGAVTVAALTSWLATLEGTEARAVLRLGRAYALENGPYPAWIALGERALATARSTATRSEVGWQLAHLRAWAGDLDGAVSMAAETETLDRSIGNERAAAQVRMFRAGILEKQGKLDEALALYRSASSALDDDDQAEVALEVARIADRQGQEDVIPQLEAAAERLSGGAKGRILGELAGRYLRRGETERAERLLLDMVIPAFERSGERRELAVARSRLADVLVGRGERARAAELLRREVLPVYERLGDVAERALALGKLADILEAEGEVAEARRVREEEELPLYRRLGDVRAVAIALSQIAGSRIREGDHVGVAEALRREVIPVLERLGDVRALAMARRNLADALSAGGDAEEALRICQEEVLPGLAGEPRERALTLSRMGEDLGTLGRPAEAAAAFAEAAAAFAAAGDAEASDTAWWEVARVAEGQRRHASPTPSFLPDPSTAECLRPRPGERGL